MTEQTPPDTSPLSATEKHVSNTRRHLLRGSVIGTPIILTLSSRPVLANTVCRSISAGMSGNLSQPNTNRSTCSGRSISYYEDSSHCPIKTKTTQFSALFSKGSYSGCNFGNKTVDDVLDINNPNTDQRVAQSFTAALFNIRNGLVSPQALSESGLRNIWAEYSTRNGTYQPFAGGPIWRGRDLLAYFDANGIVPDAQG